MEHKKNIAFLCHPYHRGGVTRWMASAAITFSKRGYRTFFVTVLPSVDFFSAGGRETMVELIAEQQNNIEVVTAKVGYEFEFGTPDFNAHTYQRLLLAHVPLGTPIILSDDSTVWKAACGLSDSYPVIGVLHGNDDHYFGLTIQYNQQIALAACVSGRISRYLKENAPQIPPEKVFTIPCGIDLPPARKMFAESPVVRLVYVGRITNHQKRTRDLVAIASLLKQRDINFQLTIIGDGDTRIAEEKRIADAQLSQFVVFAGWLSQEKVHEHLVLSDILLLTSDSEGMPISMMEGLAAGCGFVGTRVSGIEDYEFHPLAKDCFGVFEPGDIAAAVAKIEQISAVPAGTRGAAARQLALEQFSMDVCLTKYVAAIDTIPEHAYEPGSTHLSVLASVKSRVRALLRTAKMTLRKQ